MTNPELMRKYATILNESEIIDEAGFAEKIPYHSVPAGAICLAIQQNDFDDPKFYVDNGDGEPFASVQDADEEGGNTSAHHHSVYQYNGKRWVRKVSRTEPAYTGLTAYGGW